MAIFASTVNRIKSDTLACLGGRDYLEQLFRKAGHTWRKCVLDPVTTLELFVRQVLQGNTAIAHLRHLTDEKVAPSTYCESRQRLPAAALAEVVEHISVDASRHHPNDGLWCGRRVFVADATSACTPDQPAMQELWPQPLAQKPGCGFPVIKLLGLLNLATGMVLHLAMMCLNVHEMSQLSGLRAMLQPRDVLLGDRGFCSFWHLGMLLKSSVDAVFRMHQRQNVDFTPNRPHRPKSGKWDKLGMPTSRFVRRLGDEDQVVEWVRPTARPDWLSEEEYNAMPETVQVRELRYRVTARGYRTRVVTIVTTLLNPRIYSKSEIARLYGLRWEIETNFRHLKTTMKMEQLKCKTVEGAIKELIVFILVYNLIRAAMVQAGARQGANPNRVSFIDTVRWMISLCPPPSQRPDMKMIINPVRPGRWQPRVLKKRVKPYDLMNRPRHMYKEPSSQQEVTN